MLSFELTNLYFVSCEANRYADWHSASYSSLSNDCMQRILSVFQPKHGHDLWAPNHDLKQHPVQFVQGFSTMMLKKLQ